MVVDVALSCYSFWYNPEDVGADCPPKDGWLCEHECGDAIPTLTIDY